MEIIKTLNIIVNIWNLLRIPVSKFRFEVEFENGYIESVIERLENSFFFNYYNLVYIFIITIRMKFNETKFQNMYSKNSFK